VVDSEHHHDTSSVVDLVHDSVGAASCGAESGEFSLESSADPMWIVTKADSMNSTIAAAVPSGRRWSWRSAGPVTRSS